MLFGILLTSGLILLKNCEGIIGRRHDRNAGRQWLSSASADREHGAKSQVPGFNQPHLLSPSLRRCGYRLPGGTALGKVGENSPADSDNNATSVLAVGQIERAAAARRWLGECRDWDRSALHRDAKCRRRTTTRHIARGASHGTNSRAAKRRSLNV